VPLLLRRRTAALLLGRWPVCLCPLARVQRRLLLPCHLPSLLLRLQLLLLLLLLLLLPLRLLALLLLLLLVPTLLPLLLLLQLGLLPCQDVNHLPGD
jgi:hypothetical protein